MRCMAHRHIWRCCCRSSRPWSSGGGGVRPADPAAAPSGGPCCRSVSFRLLSLLEAMLPEGLLQGSAAAGAAPNGEDSTWMGPCRPIVAVVPLLRASSSSCNTLLAVALAVINASAGMHCSAERGLYRWHPMRAHATHAARLKSVARWWCTVQSGESPV